MAFPLRLSSADRIGASAAREGAAAPSRAAGPGCRPLEVAG
ncbi:hypothetical protein WME75_02125 [Sorangium sp. So ce1014]